MINITIAENGAPSSKIIELGSQFENLDEAIQFTFPSELEDLHKYVVAKTYSPKKKENITRITPLVNNRFVVGTAITKVAGTWMLYTLCKSYAVSDGNAVNTERVSISDPIIATINQNDIDVGDIEEIELDPNIKIIYDELISFKKELESNEATRQKNEKARVTAETARAEAEANREGVITKLREDLDNNTKLDGRTQRSLTALWDLNKGISCRFEDDKEKAYTKTVPSGTKLGAVNSIGGKTIVYNQYANIDGVVTGWADNTNIYSDLKRLSGHKLYCMNKCIVKNILYDDRTTYSKRFLLFDSDDSKTINVEDTLIKKEDIQVGKAFRTSKIVQAPSNLIGARVYNIGDDNIGLTVECNTWIMLIDLTQMFGEGNEPSTAEEFESMFPNSYYPYSEGELMSMGTNEVEEVGKNIFKCERFLCSDLGGTYNPSLSNSYGTSINSTAPSNSVTVTQSKIGQEDIATSYKNGYFCVLFKPIILNEDYVFSFDIIPSKKLIENSEVMILLNGNNVLKSASAQDLQIGKRTKLYFNLRANNTKTTYIKFCNGGISGVFENFQIEKGSVNTAYAPYHKNHYPIPQAIQNLDGYGWGVGNVYNYVDYEDKKFYKYVNRVDLGALTNIYEYSGLTPQEGLYIFAINISNINVKDGSSAICELFNSIPYDDLASKEGMFLNVAYNQLLISTNKCKSVEELKAYINNKYLYYGLAEPIVTDISDIIEDTFQEPFNVESGGLLTFKNSNGDGYQVAVPSDIQYVVSLKEVNP